MAKRIKALPQPFVVAGNHRLRDLKLLLQQDSLPLPCYAMSVDTLPELRRLAAVGKPFLFLLHADGRMSDILFPDDAIRPYLKPYLERIASEYGSQVYEADASKELLELLTPTIDLGELRLRKKREVTFRVKNRSDSPLAVRDVKLSCDCLTEKSIPDVIAAGQTVEFVVTLLPTTVGDFMREISFRVEGCDTPYTLEMYGSVGTPTDNH